MYLNGKVLAFQVGYIGSNPVARYKYLIHKSCIENSLSSFHSLVKFKHQELQRYYLLARRAVWRVRCGLGWIRYEP